MGTCNSIRIVKKVNQKKVIQNQWVGLGHKEIIVEMIQNYNNNNNNKMS